MRILISNDDGYQATGIKVLADSMAKLGQVTVVAPDRNRSGASNSLTLENPIRATHMPNGYISVDGTPTDCVHLAITGLLEDEPDIVLSGINAGANLGDDVLYSGTVAAAMEGRFLGFPAIALSMVSFQPQHYETAGKVAEHLVKKLQSHPLTGNTILSVNVPDVPWHELNGIQVTRLGHRHKSEPVIPMKDPRGRMMYWVGPCGGEMDAGPGTDFHAVNNNYVSITPLHVDLTRHDVIEDMRSWLDVT